MEETAIRVRNTTTKLINFRNAIIDNIEERILKSDNFIITTIAQCRFIVFVLFVIVCYISFVGTIISSEVRHILPALFGIFVVMLPIAIGVVLMSLHFLILRKQRESNGSHEGKISTHTRGLAVLGLAYIVWAIGDLSIFIDNPNLVLLFHDWALLCIVIGYSSLPSPMTCNKIIGTAVTTNAAVSETTTSKNEDSDISETTSTAIPTPNATASISWEKLTPSIVSDTPTITIAITLFGWFVVFLMCVLPLVIPGQTMQIMSYTLHITTLIYLCVLVVRARHETFFMFVNFAGVFANAIAIVSMLTSVHGTNILQVVWWLFNFQAIIFTMIPAFYIGLQLSREYHIKGSWDV